jgi:hypothetical protein
MSKRLAASWCALAARHRRHAHAAQQAGTSANNGLSCDACADGSVSSSGRAVCQACQAGEYSNAGKTGCLHCGHTCGHSPVGTDRTMSTATSQLAPCRATCHAQEGPRTSATAAEQQRACESLLVSTRLSQSTAGEPCQCTACAPSVLSAPRAHTAGSSHSESQAAHTAAEPRLGQA